MSYLKLSPKELVEFTVFLRQEYGLVIPERPAKVAFDGTRYGCGWTAWRETHYFSMVNKDGEKKPITAQNGDGTILYAVTKEQHKSWKSWKIVSEPMGWCFSRVINCASQLSRKCDLVSPAQDLYKLDYFLRRIFNTGENNG